jgi:predicted nuclease of predicted toxin-antitoxin system
LKLLVDENLSPQLVRDLADLFPDSIHVAAVQMGSTPDAVIREYAKIHGFVILTKDKDFAALSIALGAPPQVILLQTGNCSTAELVSTIRSNAVRLLEFEGGALCAAFWF